MKLLDMSSMTEFISPIRIKLKMKEDVQKKKKYNINNSSNNQRLQSAGDNDQRSKWFCSNAVFYN